MGRSCTCCVRIIADQHNQVLYLPSITTEGRRHGTRSALPCAVDAHLALALPARVVGIATRTIGTAPGDADARKAHQDTGQRARTLSWTAPYATLWRVLAGR